ncbi:hypothetical protein [Mucilaginibacter sp. SP1R1]|uniref:hypothetical protein n=1 Tax=Mucilaginibacter sp. SP1R1 TaxID=2723091 RepID=UPI0016195434|nr:hypothetical protein [Mucilaginibacter sp. SP1R1]MBB6150761.1 hypothetical protein [Mucilaginibacter sp. SP1R1]
MTYPINYKTITTDVDFYQELNILHEEAQNYLLNFKWCDEIKDSFLYTNIGSVLCIFLFEIINTQNSEDDFVWIVVGDIPPMYLDVYGAKTTKNVIEDYISLSEDWIDHIKAGKSVDKCYPFNAEPTVELAGLLEKRISFMKNTLLDNMEELLYQTCK